MNVEQTNVEIPSLCLMMSTLCVCVAFFSSSHFRLRSQWMNVVEPNIVMSAQINRGICLILSERCSSYFNHEQINGILFIVENCCMDLSEMLSSTNKPKSNDWNLMWYFLLWLTESINSPCLYQSIEFGYFTFSDYLRVPFK